MKFIANAFSLQMPIMPSGLAQWNEITKERFDYLCQDAISYVGHEDIAKMLGVECNRETLKLRENDVLLVAQVTGGRLPKGATKLPDDVTIKYYCVQIIEANTKLLGKEKIIMEE